MATIPKRPQPKMDAAVPAVTTPAPTRSMVDLPPETGYLKAEIQRLPVVNEVSGGDEFPLIDGSGRAQRAPARAIVTLVRKEVDGALEKIAGSPNGGGGGRHTFERSVARAPAETADGSELVLASKDGKAVRLTAQGIADLGGGGGGSVAWDDVTDKPDEFPPEAHTHDIEDIDSLQAALDEKAPLSSPAFTDNPTAPTQSAANNSTRLATTAYVDGAIATLLDAPPGTLDTLNEIAAALGDDPNFATTITASIGEKLAKASNLSDVADAATARTNLGLSIGTHVQAYDSDLLAIAALTSAADKVPYSTGAQAWAMATFTAAGRALVDDADAAAQRTTLGLAIGTDVQAYDADLGALAGISSTGLIARTGAGTATVRQIDGTANQIVSTNATGTSGNPTLSISSNFLPNNLGTVTHAATGKTTPVDADELLLSDSAASFALKKLTWANLKATLKSYFDTLYTAVYSSGTWTPEIKFGGASTGNVYAVGNGGTYAKLGPFVLCTGSARLSTKGSATGNATIAGLPFASDGGKVAAGIANVSGLTGMGGMLVMGMNVAVADEFSCAQSGSTGTTVITNAAFTNSTRIDFSFIYIS